MHVRTQKMERLLLLIALFRLLLLTSGVPDIVMEQVTPEDSAPVCAGGQLVFHCVSRGVALVWIINDEFFNFNSISQKGQTLVGEGFAFLLTEANSTTYVSLATAENTTSTLNGSRITCTDGVVFVDKNISVAAVPDDCRGNPKCRVIPNCSSDEALCRLTITLEDIPPSHMLCVQAYIFAFNNESKQVVAGTSPPSASFTFTKGIVYQDQNITLVNYHNQAGQQPCSFSINRPTRIETIAAVQLCNADTLLNDLEVSWNQPTLSMSSCLYANEVVWTYTVSLTNLENFTTSVYETSMLSILVKNLMPSTEYIVSVVPVIANFGLSGDAITIEIELSTSCLQIPNGGADEAAVLPVTLSLCVSVAMVLMSLS